MPLRSATTPEEWDEGGFSFYRVGTPEELAAADQTIAELLERTLAEAERMAAARGVQLAELLHETGEQLAERAIELLREEPGIKFSRRETSRLRKALRDQSEGESDS